MDLVDAQTHRKFGNKLVATDRHTVEFSGRMFQTVDSLLMVQANQRVPLSDNTCTHKHREEMTVTGAVHENKKSNPKDTACYQCHHIQTHCMCKHKTSLNSQNKELLCSPLLMSDVYIALHRRCPLPHKSLVSLTAIKDCKTKQQPSDCVYCTCSYACMQSHR